MSEMNVRRRGHGEDGIYLDAARNRYMGAISSSENNRSETAGHDRTATTESVYRHEIRPALTQGAEVVDEIFG